jgi:hypothetical protein
LDRLEAYKQKIDFQHAEPFITALFDIADGLRQQRVGFFEISPRMHAERIVYWHLKQQSDLALRGVVLLATINATDGLTLPAGVVGLLDQLAHGEGAEKEEAVPADTLLTLKLLCVEKISAAAADRQLVAHPDLSMLLYTWREWDNVDAPKAFCAELINTPAGIEALLRSLMVPATSHGLSDYVARPHWYIRAKSLKLFVAPGALEAQIASLPANAFAAEQEAIEAFRKAMERRRAGKSDDGPFAIRE